VPEVMLNDMLFNTNAETFELFSGSGQYKGYQVLSIANNHSLDMGVKGLHSTIDFLQNKGIQTGGAYKNKSDQAYKIMDVNGVKVGFMAWTFSLNQFEYPVGTEGKVNHLRLNLRNADIEQIKLEAEMCKTDGAEFIVCSIHAGNAYQAYPSEVTVNLYERLISQSPINIVLGSHPHNLQPWTYYKCQNPDGEGEKLGFILYSSGDFVAYDIHCWCQLSAITQVKLGRNTSGKVIYSVQVKPIFMEKSEQGLKLRYAWDYFEQNQENQMKHPEEYALLQEVVKASSNVSE